MSHFSQTIQSLVKNGETPRKSHKAKNPTPFPKRREKKTPLSKEVNHDLLSSLKELLTQQKADGTAASQPSAEIDRLAASSEVMKLFETLIDKMQMLKQDGITETTFHLNQDSFANSVFKGATITITEYSTAPKIFNIEFQASRDALNLFEANASSLVATLQNGKFGFSVHRMDTALNTEKLDREFEKVERDLEKEDQR